MKTDLSISLTVQEAQVLKQAMDKVSVQGIQGMAVLVTIFSKLDMALTMAQSQNGAAAPQEAPAAS